MISSYITLGLTLTPDRIWRPVPLGDCGSRRDLSGRHHREEIALADPDGAVGLASPWFDERTDSFDRWDRWCGHKPASADLASIWMPIRSISGYCGGGQLGTLPYHCAHFAALWRRRRRGRRGSLGAAAIAARQGGMRIEGHTGAEGDTESNRRLSEQRAAAVRDALRARGVDRSRLETTGYGESRPVASNGGADGRARNRRVEPIVR